MTTIADERHEERHGARERLLDTAERLFYAEGVHTVGIDRILAESGVAKASLYKHFGNKDGLVAAYLDRRHERQVARVQAALARGGTPRERILAVFGSQADLFARPDFRGCAFAAATAEGPVGGPNEERSRIYRTYVRDIFRDLAAEAGAADPDLVADQLHLVYDGAQVSARMASDADRAAIPPKARRVAETLLDVAGI